jgi:L-ornithine N5-monooxygenase
MTDREVELLAIGAGPSNLALAVALEELGFDGLAENSLVIERGPAVQWQEGLLMPWAKSQVAFVKDLVSLRNPRSEFTFLNYLHSTGRLDDFINMGNFTPYRVEVSGYFGWVAERLAKVRVETGRHCVAVEPILDERGTPSGWVARLAGGDTIRCRYLVIGAGRDPYIPPVLAPLPAGRVIHSTQYRRRVAELSGDLPYRVVVLGSAQSAAESVRALQADLPNADITWVMRSIGLRAYDTNKFTNELYYPSFVDKVFEALPEGRAQIMREMHRTNYSGVESDLLADLYGEFYLDRLAGRDRKRLVTMADITGAREAGDSAVLELTDRRTGAVSELRPDLIFLGTGFVREMPRMVRDLAALLGLERIAVTRRYRLIAGDAAGAACYLQGVNEASHGISDSLLSVLAQRGADIANDILAHRLAGTPDADLAGTPDHAVASAHGSVAVAGRPAAP